MRVSRDKIPHKTIKNAGTYEMKEPKARAPRLSSEKALTKAEELSGDRFCKINFYPDGLKEAFPLKSYMWSVAKMFPYAKEGALLVDEPKTTEDLERCVEKGKFLKSAGYRYAVLLNGVEEIEL